MPLGLFRRCSHILEPPRQQATIAVAEYATMPVGLLLAGPALGMVALDPRRRRSDRTHGPSSRDPSAGWRGCRCGSETVVFGWVLDALASVEAMEEKT